MDHYGTVIYTDKNMFDKIKKVFKPKSEPKKRKRAISHAAAEQADKLDKAADIKKGKALFWDKYPHYPQMSTIYRKMFQKYLIDNGSKVKFYDEVCGTDMCSIVSGNGPYVEYLCDDENASIIDNNVTTFNLFKKIEHLKPQAQEGQKTYIGHVFSLNPKLDAEVNIDWDELDNNTLPGGFVFIPKMITTEDDGKIPPEQLADNITFYFFIDLDHTQHWITILEAKIDKLQKEAPSGLSGASSTVIEAFKDEVTKWASVIRKLKSGKAKIFSRVYKHDDEP